ncbi:MAG: DUF2294 domain-containing protein [Actinomycetota bacterium]|nr:DUF2294 domain-containing protein [Actinomycetota bacterium]
MGLSHAQHQYQGPANGDVLAAISSRIVHLHKEFYGKGPTKARTYYIGDVVTVLLRGGFTKVEQTLLDEGRGSDVIEQRMAFQEVMRDRFTEAIEELTGRRVAAFMSGSHQDPDLIAEVFVLEPNELTADDPDDSPDRSPAGEDEKGGR